MRSRTIVVWILLVGFISAAGGAAWGEYQHQTRAAAFDGLPDAVKHTVLSEILQTCFDLEVEQEEEDGRIVYDVEFKFGDMEVELEIAADGTVQEREVTHGDDEDDDDEDDEDDNEEDDD